MDTSADLTLGKKERICGKKPLDTLFNGEGSRSMSAYPLRMVYRVVARQDASPQARILVSVPKRLLKHAVDRNRVKRQVREAYRLNKHLVLGALASRPHDAVDMAFIWLGNGLFTSRKVSARVTNLLQRVSEKL